MAAAFAEYLGVEVEFQVIDWDSKIMELDGKTIDVAWNGMTLTEDVKAAMECSNPTSTTLRWSSFLLTSRRLPDRGERAGSGLLRGGSSAGKEQADAYGFNYTEAADQATALLEVSSGTADAPSSTT